MPENHITLLVL